MARDFKGRKLIVVGGTSGMGEAAAKRVVEGGGSAVLIGKREDKLRAAVARLSSFGAATEMRANITDPIERRALVDRLQADHGDADLLVNAAGVFLPKSFLEHTADYDLYHDILAAEVAAAQATRFARPRCPG